MSPSRLRRVASALSYQLSTFPRLRSAGTIMRRTSRMGEQNVRTFKTNTRILKRKQRPGNGSP